MRIAQISDIHVGSGKHDPKLISAAVEEINAFAPDLVAVAGDLTETGHRGQFEEAKEYLDRLECPNVVVVMGNKDAKNVGLRHFKSLFGPRQRALTLQVPEGEAKVVGLDSTRTDLDVGEVGADSYPWLDSELRGWDRGPKIVVLHHHLMAVPGTGLDSGILLDAGDLMAILQDLEVDLVLAAHRHVPYFWNISGVRVVHSGTTSSFQIRGLIPPSYNVIELGPEEVTVTMQQPGEGKEGRNQLASFARSPAKTSRLYPALEWFVGYG